MKKGRSTAASANNAYAPLRYIKSIHQLLTVQVSQDPWATN